MPNRIALLDTMPTASDFYNLYWNKCPFVIHGAIPDIGMHKLIAAEELAGLAMEEGVRARLVMTAGDQHEWSCRFGPFTEKDFENTGDVDWSLLVQNVEQFHPDTAKLLRYFDFAPRWLMDDIMVSFSAKGGSVGPHMDSYHVFLVQGQGSRRWKISNKPITNASYIEGLELEVLDSEFDGDEIEVHGGDVLYIPPKFAHEGITLDPSMTFSVGFLGPKMSELLNGYSQYLSEHEEIDQRYVGEGLKIDSSGFSIGEDAADTIQGSLNQHLNSKNFNQWLVEFFTESSHEDFGIYSEREELISADAFEQKLRSGAGLLKPEYVKFAITANASGAFYLGFDSQSFVLEGGFLPLIQKFMSEIAIYLKNEPDYLNNPAVLEILLELYNHQGLEFAS